MSIDKLIISFLGFLGILFTYWFFFRKQEKVIEVKDEVEITVEGGYQPQVIVLKRNTPVKLHFIRRDPSDCLEEVVLNDFGIRKFLPFNQKVTIELNPKKVGEFTFSCGMNMYHGKIIVK